MNRSLFFTEIEVENAIIYIIPILDTNYLYLLRCKQTNKTAAIDPGSSQALLDILAEKELNLDYILCTHSHPDHIAGISKLQQETGCFVIAPMKSADNITNANGYVVGGSMVEIGNLKASVIATPGHTQDHVVFFFVSDKILFCGDSLFSLGCGRIFDGTSKQAYESICKISLLPPDTAIYPAHEYSLENSAFALSVEPDNLLLQQKSQDIAKSLENFRPSIPVSLESELETNPFLRTDNPKIRKKLGLNDSSTNAETFAALRKKKDHFQYEG